MLEYHGDYKEAWAQVEHNLSSHVDLSRTRILERIHALCLPPSYFNQKNVLDLGAGNSSPQVDGYGEGVFEPWFCRILHALGANVVGVDIGPNAELFPCVQMNILLLAYRKKMLARLLGFRKFDLVHSHRFLANHQSEDDAWHPRFRNQSPRILSEKHRNPSVVDSTQSILRTVVCGLLKNDGFFYWEHLVYQKKKGKLLLLRDDCLVL